MQDEIKKMFGIDMKIPVSMNASKKAKDFIWISNNASTGMQNLLVFKVKSEERRMKNSNAVPADDKAQIDSILFEPTCSAKPTACIWRFQFFQKEGSGR